jgi:hypothetical protein
MVICDEIVFVPGKSSQPCLMIASKAGAKLSEASPLQALLATNIRLGCKGLRGTNTLAYYGLFLNYDRKKFYWFDTSSRFRRKTFQTVGDACWPCPSSSSFSSAAFVASLLRPPRRRRRRRRHRLPTRSTPPPSFASCSSSPPSASSFLCTVPELLLLHADASLLPGFGAPRFGRSIAAGTWQRRHPSSCPSFRPLSPQPGANVTKLFTVVIYEFL